MPKKNRKNVISLFSGCGGMDLGFLLEGYEIIFATDIDADAVSTYTANIGNHILCSDINQIDLDSLPDCDVVMGGPPCQSFSLVGKRAQDDPRSNLVWSFLKVIEKKRPQVILMENVTGIRSGVDSSGKNILSLLLERLADLGYNMNHFILNAADYGVPQKRKRLFIVGHKAGASIAPPPPTHSEDTQHKTFFEDTIPWVSAMEALDDLSSPGLDKDIIPYAKAPDSLYQEFMRRENGNKVSNHQMPYMSETDLKIIKSVKPGGNYMDVPDDIATTRIKKFKESGGRTTTYGRLDPNKPGYTLNTYFSRPNVGCNIHYREDRLITIREGLRLQSFPDHFVIHSKSKKGAYTQVGNAVPPLLAKAIANQLLNYL